MMDDDDLDLDDGDEELQGDEDEDLAEGEEQGDPYEGLTPEQRQLEQDYEAGKLDFDTYIAKAEAAELRAEGDRLEAGKGGKQEPKAQAKAMPKEARKPPEAQQAGPAADRASSRHEELKRRYPRSPELWGRRPAR